MSSWPATASGRAPPALDKLAQCDALFNLGIDSSPTALPVRNSPAGAEDNCSQTTATPATSSWHDDKFRSQRRVANVLRTVEDRPMLIDPSRPELHAIVGIGAALPAVV